LMMLIGYLVYLILQENNYEKINKEDTEKTFYV